MRELKLFLTSLRLVEVDRAQFRSIKPAIVRPAAERSQTSALRSRPQRTQVSSLEQHNSQPFHPIWRGLGEIENGVVSKAKLSQVGGADNGLVGRRQPPIVFVVSLMEADFSAWRDAAR
jgi:hypothetical protein